MDCAWFKATTTAASPTLTQTTAGVLMTFLPPGFAHHDNLELIELIGPELGWASAR